MKATTYQFLYWVTLSFSSFVNSLLFTFPFPLPLELEVPVDSSKIVFFIFWKTSLHWYPCFRFLMIPVLGCAACTWWVLQIHFWSDTCWSLGSQYGSWVPLPTYIYKYCWLSHSCHNVWQTGTVTDLAIATRWKKEVFPKVKKEWNFNHEILSFICTESPYIK